MVKKYDPYTRMPSVPSGSYGLSRKEKRWIGTVVAGAGIWVAYKFMAGGPSGAPTYGTHVLTDLSVSQGDVFGITTKALDVRPGQTKSVIVSRNKTLLKMKFRDVNEAKQVRLSYEVKFADGGTKKFPEKAITRDIVAGTEESSFDFGLIFFDEIEFSTNRQIRTIYWTLEISDDNGTTTTYVFNWVVEG